MRVPSITSYWSEAVDVLQPLYSRVLVPQAVARELQQTNTPAVVRAWLTLTNWD